MSLGPSYVRLAARIPIPIPIDDQLTTSLTALTNSIKSLAGSSSQATDPSILLEALTNKGDQQSDPSNSSGSFINIPSESSSSSGESDSDNDDQDFRKRDEDDDITENISALTNTIKSSDDASSKAVEEPGAADSIEGLFDNVDQESDPSISSGSSIDIPFESGESNSDSDDQDFRKRDEDDDDVTNNLTELNDTIESIDDSRSQATEPSIRLEALTNKGSSSGESDSDSDDQDFRKRDEGSRFLELPNLGKLADYLGKFVGGDYNPDRYLSQFSGRDEDHPALLKTYQKLHRALKAMAARDLD